LAKGRILELVVTYITIGFTSGVDVTATNNVSNIIKKFNPSNKDIKGYQEYLDNFVIIVISDRFTDQDFIVLNNSCPKNVTILHWENIEEYFNIVISKRDKRKLDILARCTFYNRKELKVEWEHRQIEIDEFL
jgi:hypothetical protein